MAARESLLACVVWPALALRCLRCWVLHHCHAPDAASASRGEAAVRAAATVTVYAARPGCSGSWQGLCVLRYSLPSSCCTKRRLLRSREAVVAWRDDSIVAPPSHMNSAGGSPAFEDGPRPRTAAWLSLFPLWASRRSPGSIVSAWYVGSGKKASEAVMFVALPQKAASRDTKWRTALNTRELMEGRYEYVTEGICDTAIIGELLRQWRA